MTTVKARVGSVQGKRANNPAFRVMTQNRRVATWNRRVNTRSIAERTESVTFKTGEKGEQFLNENTTSIFKGNNL